MKRLLAATLAVSGILALTAGANAASRAFTTADVNLRAGPSTSYPAVDVVGAGDRVRVFGCLSTRAWCDVGYSGIRGWMSSSYLVEDSRARRYTGRRVVEEIDAPIISFSVGNYWDDHYRGRGFYRERARYSRPDFRDDRGPDRRDFKERRREERREFRQDRREDRRDARRERREEIRDEIREEVREEVREERRDRRRDDFRPGPGPIRNDGPPVPLYRVN